MIEINLSLKYKYLDNYYRYLSANDKERDEFANEFSSLKMGELIEKGYLFMDPFFICGIYDERNPDKRINTEDYFRFVIKNSNSYRLNYERMTKHTLVGSPKQIEWAEKIRSKKANEKSFDIACELYLYKVNTKDYVEGFSFNEWAEKEISQFRATNAGWWIDHRF